MKKIISILILSFVISCSNEPKQPETSSSDSLVSAKRTPPPFQIVAEQRTQARALAADPVLETNITYSPRTVNGKIVYDTIVTTKIQKTGTVNYTYPDWSSVTKPFKESTTTPPVDPPVPPTGESKYLKLTVRTEPMEVRGQTGTVIENIRFKNINGNAIYIGGGSKNITVRNCFFDKTQGNWEAVVIETASDVKVYDNLFNGVSCGVYGLSSQTIAVYNNEFINVRQRTIGGRGQFVQFNGVTGAGNRIQNNRGENFIGESDPEDLVSLFQCYGTQASPILVEDNTFRGGGPSASGGGIMSGDYGGNWQIIRRNKILNPGQYGMAAAGGSNIIIEDNLIVAKQQPFTNNPLYVWAQQGASCNTITVRRNKIWWIDKSGTFNGGWNAGNCSNTSFEYPARFNSYADGEVALGIKPHFFLFVNAAELLTIRK